MTDLKSKIEKRIEQEAEKYASQRCYLPEDQAFIVFAKIDHKAGARSMLGLVMEMAEALALIERSYPLSGERMAHQDFAKRTLQKLEAWAEGKE